MPLSDWQGVPLVTTGDMWTAAQHNTYIRANQQALYDGLTGGSGAGSNCDKVDGRDATVGDFPNLAWVDKIEVTVPAGYSGWLTFAKSTVYRSTNIFTLVDYGAGGWSASWHGVIARGPISQTIKEISFSEQSEIAGSRAVRLVCDDDSSICWAQVYVINIDADNPRTVHVYREDVVGGEWPWALTTEAPADGATTKRVVTLGNGSWRLMRSLAGTGAGVGYMSADAKQSVFTVTHDGFDEYGSDAIDTKALDGDTGSYAYRMNGHDSTGYSDGTVYLTAEYPIALEKFKIWAKNGNSDCVTSATAYYKNDAGNWVLLASGSGGGTGAYAGFEISFDRTVATEWKIYMQGGRGDGGDSYVSEISIYQSSTLVFTGVPVGCAVKLYDADGNLLEVVRRTAWYGDQFVLATTPTANITKIGITLPNGATTWLRYLLDMGGVSSIDGGDLQDGDVLTLVNTEKQP